MKSTGVLLLISFILLLSAGCATIVNGTHQDVGITSIPTGAKVIIDNREFGETPLIAKLSRKDNHTVRIELEGYLPYEAVLTRKVSGWVWGNVLFGGLIGLAVDAISGGIYKLTPEQVNAVLRKEESLAKDSIFIAVVLRPDPSWRKIGQLARER